MARRKKSDTNDEIQASRQRSTTLSSATLRVNDNLELSVVLQEVVDRACELTGAGVGLICMIDEDGEVRDFVSRGVTKTDRKRFEEEADGPQLFEHLRDLPGPVRIDNLPEYVQTHGFSLKHMVSKTLLAMPMRHHGTLLGNFFLGKPKKARNFTIDDEEMIEVFASQAASSIANARAFSGEKRALADLAAVIENSPNGVVVFDGRTGRPTSINREARALVKSLCSDGEEAENVLSTLSFLIADGREIQLTESTIVNGMADVEKLRGEEVVISHPDGGELKALVNVTPIQGEDGETTSVLLTMQSLESLEEIERQRTEFVSMVSHELRAPLAAIKGSAMTVLERTRGFSDVEMLQFFRIVNTQADRMQNLIADLLEAGRVELGTLSLNTETCDLVDLIDRARNMFLSGGAKHPVHIDIPHDLTRVKADPERIVQVLGNLLANAARHSPVSKTITITAEQDGVFVAVSVVDQGPGVDPDVLPTLFQKRVLHEAGDVGQDRATGLGLAICKGLIELHGGRIHAENLEGRKGSRFVFTLPAVGPRGSKKKATSASAVNRRHTDHSILVIDDDPAMLRFVKNGLAEAGFEVVVAPDADTIANLIRDERPNLVLLDLVLPGLDGIELMKTIPELSDVPVIFISAYGRDETIARALDNGAVDYIVKPFSPTELCARVTAALRLHEKPLTFTLSDLTIEFELRRVSIGGQEITLTPIEYEILRVLALNAGKVVTFEYIRRHAWRRQGSEDSQRVRAFIRKLRMKLGTTLTTRNIYSTCTVSAIAWVRHQNRHRFHAVAAIDSLRLVSSTLSNSPSGKSNNARRRAYGRVRRFRMRIHNTYLLRTVRM